MKKANFSIKPAPRRAKPKYPTMAEIGVADLSRVPARWQRLHTVAAALGTAAMSLKAIALGSDATARPESSPYHPTSVGADHPASVGAALRAARRSSRPVTDVAPIPPAALAGDGEGAFGCVAMNPPVMLPESDALAIIEREFLKRGIKLVDGPTLDGAMVPGPTGDVRQQDASAEDRVREMDPLYKTDIRRDITLDLGTTDGSIMVEYVSSGDVSRFTPKEPGYWCSVSVFRTRETAERLAKGFAEREKGKSVKVGVFYDPCARVPEDSAVLEEARKKAKAENSYRPFYEQKDKEGRRLAEEKLVAQIEAFFKHIGKEAPGR